MSRRLSPKTSFLSGLILVLMLALTLVNNTNPIGFSKNALFRVKTPEIILEAPGRLAWAGEDTYYNYSKGNLKKIQQSGRAIWNDTPEGQLLWMGPEGVIISQGNTICMLDGNGELNFEKADFFEKPRILCVQKQYLLLTGRNQGYEFAVLLNESGDVVWQLPFKGSLISGSVHSKGIYTALNLVDEKVVSRMVVVGSTGEILWNETPSTLVYQVKVVDEGIGAIVSDRAFLMDYKGRLLWEYPFEGHVIRGDIGDDGFITVVVTEKIGQLSQYPRPKVIMLSSHGNLVCSYSLDNLPNLVNKSKDFIYIVDDYGVMVLSQEGLLVSSIKLKGIKELVPAESNHIIALQEDKSSLLGDPGGRY
ncbi:MAG TPA: hypothetical protein GXZ27_00285 [Thermoanaerobacterales bacterium]|mgnify:CR=1 FL=1|jgi:hypothetical protein|nr:hypothetical protein [Thermoanaerobacterales bacterium]